MNIDPLKMCDLPASRLSDGTDISRMTVDEIKVHQRRLSPKFPTLDEARERRQQLRETVAARTLMFFCGAGLAGGYWDRLGWVVAGVCFIGFVITCFVAGNRHHVRNGGGRGRPF